MIETVKVSAAVCIVGNIVDPVILNSWTSVGPIIRSRGYKYPRRLTAVRAKESECRGHLACVHNGRRREEEADMDCKEETVPAFCR
ncbi:hypothetical protein PAMP_010503 [Pampus punctatissimus]